MSDPIFTTQDTLNIRLQHLYLEKRRKELGIKTRKNIFKHAIKLLRDSHGK